ncbi:hypothetical protein [Flavobacterium sp. 102]|uniref:hypothetical protein n=1 Tax=Flavobacterium sp. 102 TaxID=2135623 RepID=UPI000EAB58DC|nr:hypothetical protein [Flavobacterium sp. 102]RKS00407.1 hypothetical protein C8C84_0015 [Flavobacterium sp. 102]RKS03733.1 hypothetical protein C8C84_3499 [Flavobacterium sp. 102]
MMAVKYKYQIGNSIIETSDLATIPNGVQYEAIEYSTALSAEEITQNYLTAIKSKYEKYKADGIVAYEDFRARIVFKVRTGQLSQAQGVTIKRYLGPSYDEINTNGDWVTAKAFLSETIIAENDAFVEDYKSEALQIMADYIIQNFPQ